MKDVSSYFQRGFFCCRVFLDSVKYTFFTNQSVCSSKILLQIYLREWLKVFWVWQLRHQVLRLYGQPLLPGPGRQIKVQAPLEPFLNEVFEGGHLSQGAVLLRDKVVLPLPGLLAGLANQVYHTIKVCVSCS